MTQNELSPLEEARRAWSRADEALTDLEIDRRMHGFGVLVRGIAEQGSVSPSAFAEALDLEPAAARDLFESLATAGVELDKNGHVIGAALTTMQTPHEVHLGNRTLYAWCALDTLFIPGLLGRTAQIESKCPKSGEIIRLTVSADRVEAREPSGVWLSVFLPAATRDQIGPTTPTWSQMHFFHAREAAEEWVSEREAVVALSLGDAFELAHGHWVRAASHAQNAK